MKTTASKPIATAAVAAALSYALMGCGAQASASAQSSSTGAGALEGTPIVDESSIIETTSTTASRTSETSAEAAASTDGSAEASDPTGTVTLENMSSDGALDTADLFTERDLAQAVDTSDAKSITLADGQDVTITEEGTYVVSGTATNASIIVEADDAAKVQIVLAGASITNDDFPAIYVKSADKVFVTTAAGTENKLSVTGSFVADGDTNTDAVIFSKDDLTLSGEGSLVISSTANGVTSKDDLKVTGGAYTITADHHGLEANDSVRIAGGSFSITAGTDAIHAENSDDDTLGYVYVCGGDFSLQAGSDGIQATTIAQVDAGSFSVVASEGIEATYVQINGGTIYIAASDDGINGTTKSYSIGTPTVEIRGGDTTIEMAQGDTDALDCNGDLVISGGTVNITGQFAFDFDGQGTLTGGTVYVNGEQVTSLQNSMMGGPGGGMMGGRGQMGDPSQMGEMGQMGGAGQMGGRW